MHFRSHSRVKGQLLTKANDDLVVWLSRGFAFYGTNFV